MKIKAYLFSKGETTTDLAEWSLKRLGFDVLVYRDERSTLYKKYQLFIQDALNTSDEVFIRADADVIVHKNFLKLLDFFKDKTIENLWWVNGKAFCFHRFELVDTAPMIISRKALEAAQNHMHKFEHSSRPETELTRIPDFFFPRRFLATDIFTGIHGLKQSPVDIDRVLAQKRERNQLKDWDWDLLNKLKELV